MLPVEQAYRQLADIAISSGNAAYRDASHVYNPAFQGLPYFVVVANTVADVQRCLKIAVLTGTPVFVKSGGHSFAGYSTVGKEGFLLSLEKFASASVRGDRVKAGAGARWKDVYRAVNGSGYLAVGGCCTSVGLGGYVVGGGFGLQSRYSGGLAADKVLSFTMVTADGERVVQASRNKNTDLFWALRGGGGGNFGVIIDMTMQLTVSPKQFHWTRYSFSGTQSMETALNYIGRNMASFPKELNLDVIISKYGLELHAVYTDLNHGEVMKTLAGFRPTRVSHPIPSCDNFLEFVTKYSDAHGYRQYETAAVYIKGAYIQILSSTLASDLVRLNVPAGTYVSFIHLGGDIGKIASNVTAYAHRDAQYVYYTYARYKTPQQRNDVYRFSEHVQKVIRRSGCSRGSYVNYMDRRLKDWQREYYNHNYHRLCKIKNTWNPPSKGGLHFQQEIGSNWQPDL